MYIKIDTLSTITLYNYNELTSICLVDRAVAASNCTTSRADSSSIIKQTGRDSECKNQALDWGIQERNE